MSNKITESHTLHASMGSDLAKLGGLLRCEKCGHEIPLPVGRLGDYLANGWPEHCGETMTWVTRRQLEEGKK